MRIFVAGPWGDYSGASPETIEENVQRAKSVGQRLVHLGHQVYIPHTMCKGWTNDFSFNQMRDVNDSFIIHWAEALFRIPGKSNGSDGEVRLAGYYSLYIFDDIQETDVVPRVLPGESSKDAEEIWMLYEDVVKEVYDSNRL